MRYVCTKCGIEKLKEDFYPYKNNTVKGIMARCRICIRVLVYAQRAMWTVEQREASLKRVRKWGIDNPRANRQTQLARNKRRQCVQQQATPVWANAYAMKAIYAACPVGYHVDHIVPLNAKDVCGLHVQNNLQYLSAKVNLAKGNRWQTQLSDTTLQQITK